MAFAPGYTMGTPQAPDVSRFDIGSISASWAALIRRFQCVTRCRAETGHHND